MNDKVRKRMRKEEKIIKYLTTMRDVMNSGNLFSHNTRGNYMHSDLQNSTISLQVTCNDI